MSECGCIYIGDFGSPEFSWEREIKARKKHRCGECRRDILPGETYEYVTGKWDGAFLQHRTCTVCLEIRKVFFCDGWTFGGQREELWEHILAFGGEISSECITPLSETARDVVCGMIDKYFEENPLEVTA